jgi:esterase/lipase superfamily enzyme/TRAP-type C4-dicarboxylate transport system substrate-binding protein
MRPNLRLAKARRALDGVRCGASPWRAIMIAFCLMTAQVGMASAQVANQTITVLIESNMESVGRVFLAQLTVDLAAEVRERVTLNPVVVSSTIIQSALSIRPWDMAILSTLTLKNAEIKTNAVAFEMPFVFSDIGNVTALQQSPVGQAGLSTMSDSGITGLVYLNGGLTLLAERKELDSPEDLKRRTVAVFSSAQGEVFKKIGSVPIQVQQDNNTTSLMDNTDVDAVPISSSNSASWVFPNNSFLLTDSVRAQVGMVVTRDQSWNDLPFADRAAIGDAAIAASASNDRRLAETEHGLADKVRSSGVSLVSFKAEDASRATRQWIEQQPQGLRPIYSTVYDYVKSTTPQNPRPPGGAGRGGQNGEIYFATTRDDTKDPKLVYRFGDARTNVVKCGRIKYSQDDPTADDAAVDGPVTADTKSCGDMLRAVLHGSQRMLIYIHGFNNRFSEAAERAMVLKNVLGSDTEVVLWSWPSKRDGLAGKYDYDKESVSGIARQLLETTLRSLKGEPENRPIDLLAHSMGAWHLLGAIETLSSENSWPNIRNIVFAAPDVPDDEFNFGLEAINRVAKRNTLYACGWDMALALSEQINAHPRAGTGGSNIVVSKPMDSIDVAATLSINHSYVFEAGKVRDDLSTLVTTAADPATRSLDEVPKPPWRYWRFN